MFFFILLSYPVACFFFFFNDTATTEIYTLSLHDALPIFYIRQRRCDLRIDQRPAHDVEDRKSTRLNSSHPSISYAVFCLKKKNTKHTFPHLITKDKKRHYNDIEDMTQ